MSTALLLICSNVFMTFAWYGHLKYGHEWPLWKAIVVSWGIALIEYCLAVPANRLGSAYYSTAQLKTMQEVITLLVFTVFGILAGGTFYAQPSDRLCANCRWRRVHL